VTNLLPEQPIGRAREPLPTTELLLVRHGQGECNATGTIGGRAGCQGLSDLGRRQSLALAERIAQLHANRPFDLVLCTPRRRVLQCAQTIAAGLARPVVVVENLRGQDFGAADGRSWQQITEAFGGPPWQYPDRPIAPGAEPWNDYAARVLAALRTVLEVHAGRRILLVAHGKTIGLAGALLSGAADPASSAPGLVIDHGALSYWSQSAEGWAVLADNDQQHLASRVS
jgi:probable phosphoglycerate mutase